MESVADRVFGHRSDAREAQGVRVGDGVADLPDAESGRFRAGSANWDGFVESRGLVEARIPTPHIDRTVDPLIVALRRRGSITSQRLDGSDGYGIETGKLVVDAGLHVVQSDGSAHAKRFALGVTTSRPAAGTFAPPESRNQVYGPGFQSWSIAMQKAFPIIPSHESNRLIFRAEAFNFTNHPNLDVPNTTPTSSIFGKVTTKGGTYASERQMQFSLRYQF